MLKPLCFGLTSLLSAISSIVIDCCINNYVFILGPVDLSFIVDNIRTLPVVPTLNFVQFGF